MKWKMAAVSFIMALALGAGALGVAGAAHGSIFDMDPDALVVWEMFGEGTMTADGFLAVDGDALQEEAWEDLMLYVDDALVYDLRDGLRTTIRAMSDAYPVIPMLVVYVPTEHAEPFAHAVIIYCYPGAAESADFSVIASDNIRYGESQCIFVSADGRFRIVIDEDTEILNDSGTPINRTEIKPGDEMLVWADYIAASFPGQIHAGRIVVMEY